MVQYTLVQSPEVLLNVPGKDSTKARERALDQLMELMDNGSLGTELADGFSPEQFVEVKEQESMRSKDEDAVTEAVQVLSNLANLKLKAQSLKGDAIAIRNKIDLLFTDEPISEADINELKEGFKVLKTFAQANLRYRESRAKAETAREVLDQALKGD